MRCSLHAHTRKLSEEEGISINQFVASAVAEKLSAPDTERYLPIETCGLQAPPVLAGRRAGMERRAYRDAQMPQMKTVRFSSVVAQAGRPEQALVWSDPRRDPDLKKADRESRLLTVHQVLRGGKKDHGAVGLESGQDAQYYIFPRSLKRFAGAQVVGIDYDLIEDKPSDRRPRVPAAQTGHQRRAAKPASPAPKPHPAKAAPAAPKPKARLAAAGRPSTEEIRREIAAAVRQLRAGRTDAARERLEALRRRIKA